MKIKFKIYVATIMLLFVSCKKQAVSLSKKDTGKVPEKTLIEIQTGININNKSNDDCIDIIRELIVKSSIKNSFLETLNVDIDKQELTKLTIKLYDNSDSSRSPVGWIILNADNKKLLDITNDPKEPIELKYNNLTWIKVIDCYFKKESLEVNCHELETNEGVKEECIFKNKTIEAVYSDIIEKKEIENWNHLLPSLPTKNISKEINQSGLIAIEYDISLQEIMITFQYEGGVSTILLEKQGLNTKRTIIYSAD